MKNKELYSYIYTKHEGLGFTNEKDLEILYSLYPDAKRIRVIYVVKGEAHFVIEY